MPNTFGEIAKPKNNIVIIKTAIIFSLNRNILSPLIKDLIFTI